MKSQSPAPETSLSEAIENLRRAVERVDREERETREMTARLKETLRRIQDLPV